MATDVNLISIEIGITEQLVASLNGILYNLQKIESIAFE